MAIPFPSPQQCQSLYCFLSPLEEHDILMVDLNNIVLLSATPGLQPPSREVLCSALQTRYGESQGNWNLAQVQGGFLVRSPDWLQSDTIEGDAPFWEGTFNLIPLPWQTQNRADPLPQCQTVHITIHRFPVDLWHPFYFRQAVAAMGILTGVSKNGLRGLNKDSLRLRLLCADFNLIPYNIYIGHENQWSTCQVDLDGRPSIGEDNQPPSPPSPPSPSSPGGGLNRLSAKSAVSASMTEAVTSDPLITSKS